MNAYSNKHKKIDAYTHWRTCTGPNKDCVSLCWSDPKSDHNPAACKSGLALLQFVHCQNHQKKKQLICILIFSNSGSLTYNYQKDTNVDKLYLWTTSEISFIVFTAVTQTALRPIQSDQWLNWSGNQIKTTMAWCTFCMTVCREMSRFYTSIGSTTTTFPCYFGCNHQRGET